MLKNLKLPGFFIDAASMITSRFFILGIDFLSSILVARLLGPESKGILTFFLVVPSLLKSFADLGLRQSTMYFMGKQTYSDQEIISANVFLAWFTSLAGIIITLCAYIFSGFHIKYGWWLTIIPLAIIPGNFIYTYASGVLLAKVQIKKFSIFSAVGSLSYLITVLVIILLGRLNVTWVLWARVISAMIPAIVILFEIRKHGQIKPAFFPELLIAMMKRGVIYALALLLLELNYNFDIMILEKMTTPVVVGIYSVGANLANLLWIMPTALTTVNFAHSARATNRIEFAKKTARLVRVTLWAAFFPLAFLYALAPFFIPWVYSEAYRASAAVLQAILPGVWAMIVVRLLHSDFAGRGQPEAGLWVFFLSLVINIFLNIVWIPLFGAVGSAWASTVSYIISAVLIAVVYVRSSEINITDLFILRKSDLQFIKK